MDNGKLQKLITQSLERTGLSVRKHYGILLITLVCGVVSYKFYTGLYLSDDFGTYIANFFRLYRGETLVYPFRLPLLLIEWLSYILFGGKITSLPILFSFLYPIMVILVYAITYLLSKKTGLSLIAAIICGSSSTLYVYSGAILPDNVGAVCLLAAFLFFIKYIQSENRNRYFYLVVSVSFALGTFLMREAYIIAFFVGIVPLAHSLRKNQIPKKIIQDLYIYGISFVVVIVVYHLILVLAGYGQAIFAQYSYANDAVEWNKQRGIFTFMDRYRYTRQLIKEAFPSARYLLWLVGLSGVISIIKRSWDIFGFSLSIFVLLGVMTFAPIKTNPYTFYPLQIRYIAGLWAMVSIPIALTLGISKKTSKVLVMIGMIFSLMTFYSNYDANIGNAGNLYYSFVIDKVEDAFVHAQEIRPEGKVILDPSYSRFSWYANYMYPDSTLAVFQKANDNQITKNDVLILNMDIDAGMAIEAKDFADRNGLVLVELPFEDDHVLMIYYDDQH